MSVTFLCFFLIKFNFKWVIQETSGFRDIFIELSINQFIILTLEFLQ